MKVFKVVVQLDLIDANATLKSKQDVFGKQIFDMVEKMLSQNMTHYDVAASCPQVSITEIK